MIARNIVELNAASRNDTLKVGRAARPCVGVHGTVPIAMRSFDAVLAEDEDDDAAADDDDDGVLDVPTLGRMASVVTNSRVGDDWNDVVNNRCRCATRILPPPTCNNSAGSPSGNVRTSNGGSDVA